MHLPNWRLVEVFRARELISRLRDVVVSQPIGTYIGVEQWDFGKMGKTRLNGLNGLNGSE
jgi:hypothetical protein